MTNITFFIIFIPILSTILLLINFILAPHKPNKDKDAQFECGFSSFTQMSRLPFSISFFIYALLFLLFDLEILLVYPYVVSAYNNSIYGLIVMLVFFILLTIGFIFELGKKALQIDSRQTNVNMSIGGLKDLVIYKVLYEWPWISKAVYHKYPMTCSITLYIIVWISSKVFYPNIIYCDSGSESDSEPEIVYKDKGKGREVIIESGPSNSDAEPKGKGKQVVVESAPTNVKPSDSDTNTNQMPEMPFTMYPEDREVWETIYDDDDRRRHLAAISRLGLEEDQWLEDKPRSENVQDILDTMDEIRLREADNEIAARKLLESMQEEENEAMARDFDEFFKKQQESIAREVKKSIREEEEAVARTIAESLKEEDEAMLKRVAESIKEEEEAKLRKVAESIEGSEDLKKRKLEESVQNDESIARKMQKSFDEGDDSSDDYSVLSSLHGGESPNTYQKKLEVAEVEFNLKKKK